MMAEAPNILLQQFELVENPAHSPDNDLSDAVLTPADEDSAASPTSSSSQPINQKLLDLLECPVCYDYMLPPITLCQNGHNVCKTCRPRLFQCPTCRHPFLRTRNITLEQIAHNLCFPCWNRDSGCSEVCTMDHLDEHRITCPHQPEYHCPLLMYADCSWHGKHHEIISHVEDTHSDKILTEQNNSCTWELTLATKDTRVIFALDEIFLYRERLDTLNKKFYVTVQYFGPKQNSTKYIYETELSTSTGNQKIIMCNVTLGIDEDVEQLYLMGNCIRLEYDVVSNFSKGNNLKYILTIARTTGL